MTESEFLLIQGASECMEVAHRIKDEAAKYAIERLFDDFSVFTLYAP